MPRALWNGAISFGLVTVPITLEPATESHDVHFRQVHLEDGGRVRYQKRCEIDGQVLTEDEIGKAYEVTKDQLIPITEDDLSGMPLPTARAVEVVAFIDADSVDPVAFGAGDYYARAKGAVAAKPYTLLREALSRTDKVAVVKYALRGRERLGLLRPVGEALSIQGLHWDDEIRSPAELAPPETDVSEKEIEGALTLMETMTVASLTDLDVTDHYTEALHEVIEAKAEHREPAVLEGGDAATAPVVDLMAALEASVAKAKEGRGESGEPATVHEMPAKPKKKTAAKKTAAKKTAAKKTTRRKSA
ncbi:DNA repair protein [Streptomyces sp. CB02009]|uniref:non-homologous end joining protein Ku n=1 Tax=Streptomyces sp. CB02009 TaxID=1703938 RepID=UPI00093E45F1|nr:Ku protein [Streptomyces sp. CB02009]OKJ48625.1 DNA repair protein [Streptomyces sp. CB02009]